MVGFSTIWFDPGKRRHFLSLSHKGPVRKGFAHVHDCLKKIWQTPIGQDLRKALTGKDLRIIYDTACPFDGMYIPAVNVKHGHAHIVLNPERTKGDFALYVLAREMAFAALDHKGILPPVIFTGIRTPIDRHFAFPDYKRLIKAIKAFAYSVSCAIVFQRHALLGDSILYRTLRYRPYTEPVLEGIQSAYEYSRQHPDLDEGSKQDLMLLAGFESWQRPKYTNIASTNIAIFIYQLLKADPHFQTAPKNKLVKNAIDNIGFGSVLSGYSFFRFLGTEHFKKLKLPDPEQLLPRHIKPQDRNRNPGL